MIGSARRALDDLRATAQDLRHPLPLLRSDPTRRAPPTIYFCAPDYDHPSGGIRVLYRHVDLLNEAGIRAAVLHRRAGFRCTWFANDTRVVCSLDAAIGPGDLVVVGELALGLLRRLGPGFRFVIFNQNPYLTWRRASRSEVRERAASPDLAAIVTVSDHGRELLRYCAPEVDVIRVHNSIDPRRFYVGQPPLRPTISYMPRRNGEDAKRVLAMLDGRGLLQGWDVVALDRLTEREVADRLRATTVFLNLAYHEGFGLPAAEAMACGAYAVGFHGFAGREYLRPRFSAPVEPGDILGLARALEGVIGREAATPGWCRARGEEAARFIATSYAPEREREEVVACYRRLVDESERDERGERKNRAGRTRCIADGRRRS